MVKAHPIPSTQPYLNHDTLTQDQQARHLGVKQETVMNLGHPYPVSRLTENPAAVVDYTNNDVARKCCVSRAVSASMKSFVIRKTVRRTNRTLIAGPITRAATAITAKTAKTRPCAMAAVAVCHLPHAKRIATATCQPEG